MNTMVEWLKEARPEIVGGLVVALILWLFSLLPLSETKHEHKPPQDNPVQVLSEDASLNQDEAKQPEKDKKKRFIFDVVSPYEFLELCKAGNARKVEEVLTHSYKTVNGKSYLGAKSYVKFKDLNGKTALMVAVEGGHANVVEILLKHGADANMEVFAVAMACAQVYGHKGIIELLIQYGKGKIYDKE